MENNENRYSHCDHPWCGHHRGGVSGFGTLLLVVGGFFLAQDLGWLATDVSFWPIFLMALGLYFIIRR